MSKVDYHKIVRSPEPKSSNTEFKELENYRIEGTIDEGTFGKVKLGIHLPTKEKVAIKILEKSKIVDSDDSERIYREISFLKKLKHGNIIKLYEIIENSKNYYLIMEYAAGGELFNYIVKKRHLDDDDASYFFTQIINGLDYIHKNNIVHRDLKPENLLLTKDRVLKIIDFGLSNSYKPGQLLSTPCGSPCYASPEMILGKKYAGLCIDIWSIGIILYAMVCGYLPFEDKNNDKLYKKILEGKLEFPDYISDQSKELIIKFLNTNPKKRITLEEIKASSFYKQGEKQIKKEEAGLFDNVKLHEIVLETMSENGFPREETLKNLQANKHNNITTTYTLFFHKYKINPTLCENFLKTHENLFNNSNKVIEIQSKTNNLSINVNTQNHIGNININIMDCSKNFKLRGSESPKNTAKVVDTKKSVSEKTPSESNNTTKLEEAKKDVLMTPSRKENSVTEEEKNLTLNMDTNHNNDPNTAAPALTPSEKKSTIQASPKRVKDLIIETTVFMKNKQPKATNIINNKFNTSMSYEENLNRSLNENSHHKYKASSPSERVNRDKNLFNLKKNQAAKTFTKNIPSSPKQHGSRSPHNEQKRIDLRTSTGKYNEMDVIIEENENHKENQPQNNTNNIKSIKVDINNNSNRKARETSLITGIITNPSKVESVAIDFKKKVKNLSIVDFNNDPNNAQATTKVSKKNSSDNLGTFKSPQHKNTTTKDEPLQTKRMNSQTKTKDKNSYLQCSPVHRSIQNSINNNIGNSPNHSKPGMKIEINIKNKNSLKTAASPERKSTTVANSNLIDSVTKNNNLTTISHGERNMVPRSISPIVNIGNFNNTTNSLKEGQNSTNGTGSNISSSPIHNNTEKTSKNNADKAKPSTAQANVKSNVKPGSSTAVKKMDANTAKKLANNSSNSSSTNSSTITPSYTKKQPSATPISIDLKKDKNALAMLSDSAVTEKKSTNKASLFTDKKYEKKPSIQEKKLETIDLSKGCQTLPAKPSTEKLRGDGKKELSGNNSKKGTNINITKQKTLATEIPEAHEVDEILEEKKQTEFACCTICDFQEIQGNLSKFCEEKNVEFKDVGGSRFECSTENFVVGLEFFTEKTQKKLKIYQVSGAEQEAKELMKNFLKLAI